MQTINIQTNLSSNVLENIKSLLLSLDPLAKITLHDENTRDFIFKGYTIPYLIDDDIILLLGIYNSNEWN